MKIHEVPTAVLRRALAATERAVGPDSSEAKAIRNELHRRNAPKRSRRRRAVRV